MVELVNALTPGLEHGHAVPPLTFPADAPRVAFLRRPPTNPGAMQQLSTLAAELRLIIEAAGQRDLDQAARLSNRLLDRYRPVAYLKHSGEQWEMHFRAGTDTGQRPEAAGFVAALAAVLSSAAWDRLGVCSAERCDRVFIDLSRNGTRRYCSPSCQNRTKAAALRARRRAEGGPASGRVGANSPGDGAGGGCVPRSTPTSRF